MLVQVALTDLKGLIYVTALEDLRIVVTADIPNYDEAATVTVSLTTTGSDGEDYCPPSAFGRMVSATFSLRKDAAVPADFSVGSEEVDDLIKEATNRVGALVKAGLFADTSDPEEFPGIKLSDIDYVIRFSL